MNFPDDYYTEIPPEKLPRVVADLADEYGLEGYYRHLEHRTVRGVWVKSLGNVHVTSPNYRLKRPMLEYKVSRPESVRLKPRLHTTYWYPCFSHPERVDQNSWTDSGPDNWRLDAGIIYRTKEDAIAAARAMIGESQ